MDTALPINYEFFFYFLDRHYPNSRDCFVLDYGCGDGKLVREAIVRGYRFFGVDNFYGDANMAGAVLSQAEAEHLPVRALMANGMIPWPDNTFDVIISNQVIEHVVDLDLVASEMYRVLRGGENAARIYDARVYC